MMKLSIIVFLIFASCQQRTKEFPPFKGIIENKITIGLQPFVGAKNLAQVLKDSLEKRVNAKFEILKETSLPANSFYKPRRRYVADTILNFLRDNNSRPDKVIGITTKDISTQKNGAANWGIMGLGFCLGESCVISSFRVMPTSKNKKQFNERMTVLALHELGHTFSLPHCANEKCIMRDAEGKMRLDYTNAYCSKCRSVLMKAGLFN
jgi:archaemetzincin